MNVLFDTSEIYRVWIEKERKENLVLTFFHRSLHRILVAEKKP